MLSYLWLVPALPFLGFLILAFFGSSLSKKGIAGVGVTSVGLSALVTILIGFSFVGDAATGESYTQSLWNWFSVGGYTPQIGLHLDALSLTFIFVITFVGFLIHLFSSEFMKHEPGYGRFFAAMNLFVGSMLMLVLADNLVLLYLGWEGVGLCSFLLIGFYYKKTKNGIAAQKAFIITRIGDTALGIGLFLLFASHGTLNFVDLEAAVGENWAYGEWLPLIAALLIVGGAIGKSAQLPLQTWLPDAMAGPSPVSALIHAATMVTAGVYIIARTNFIFELAPIAMGIVAVIGALTLFVAGITALMQVDIKRVLAYSTISQLGYMFMALGAGAWSAAIFHFMTHGFFKALLFLGAGVIIECLRDEHDMFKMGGLKDKLPVTFWTFLVGAACLAAFPLITAGFYSKEMILFYSFASETGSIWFYIIGVIGGFITALYTFRMVFVTFFGEAKMEVSHKPGNLIKAPLIILAVFSILIGFIQTPKALGYITVFSDYLVPIVPAISTVDVSLGLEILLQLIAVFLALAGLYVAYLAYFKKSLNFASYAESGTGAKLYNFFYSGWQFDKLYDTVFVKPFKAISSLNKNDIVDKFYDGLAAITRVLHYIVTMTQTGRLRWYVMGVTFGTVLTLTLIIVL